MAGGQAGPGTVRSAKAPPNCVNHHRNRVMPVTYKTSIFDYTVIDLIALGEHDGGPGDQTRAGSMEQPGGPR